MKFQNNPSNKVQKSLSQLESKGYASQRQGPGGKDEKGHNHGGQGSQHGPGREGGGMGQGLGKEDRGQSKFQGKANKDPVACKIAEKNLKK